MRASLILILLCLAITACQQPVDFEHERALLLASNERQRQAHMENDGPMLSAELADTVLTVQAGAFSTSVKPAMLERWNTYFSNVKYSAWDDLEPPVIHISQDGSLATVSVRKITISTYQNGPIDTTYFAWTSEYKKYDGQWKIYKISSTRTP